MVFSKAESQSAAEGGDVADECSIGSKVSPPVGASFSADVDATTLLKLEAIWFEHSAGSEDDVDDSENRFFFGSFSEVSTFSIFALSGLEARNFSSEKNDQNRKMPNNVKQHKVSLSLAEWIFTFSAT